MSSSSCFFYWLRLEVNILAIIPIFVSVQNTTSANVTLKYFISQSVASVVFLFAFFRIFKIARAMLAIQLAILFKLGLPPFHSWLTRIAIERPLKILFLILVVQKFIPLHILSNSDPTVEVITLAIVVTLCLTLFSLKNIARIRLTLLISAWGNSLWLTICVCGGKVWAVFLALYGVFLLAVMLLIELTRSQKLSSLLVTTVAVKALFSLNFLNLAGLPPFSGFFIKLVLLKLFLGFSPPLLILLLLFISLVVLWAYLAVTFYLYSSPHPRRARVQGRGGLFTAAIISTASILTYPVVMLLAV